MKTIWKRALLFVAMAAVATSIQSCCGSSSVSAEDAVIDAIMTRSSVRSYTSQVVEQDKIETMLRAGMAAPTAGNTQPWEFVVITDRAILDELPSVAGGMKMASGAPLAIAVCGVPALSMPNMPDYWVQDCSAATQNILLAAHAMGLGAVWCGAFPDGGTGREARITELLKLPEGIVALNVIVIGYPNSEPSPKDKWKADRVHYNVY
ncbi:MAG: nitroreductase family protein [Rikenellaceae bacterium]